MTIPYSFHERLVLRTPGYGLQTTIVQFTLDHFLEDAYFLEALFLASPVLHAELLKYRQGKITEARAVEKLHFSVAKYYLRMCSRCTPFGLFSGCSVTEWNPEKTRIIINKGSGKRHT